MKLKITKKHLAILAFAFATVISTPGLAQIYWDFGVTGALSAYPASGIPANITVDSVTKGNSTGTPFLSTSSVSSGYTGASAGGNAGVTAKIGPLDYTVNATSGSAFYEITLTPAAGYYIDVTGISFGTRSTATGPKKYSIRTSLDAYATEEAGDTIATTVSSWGLRTQTLSVTGTAGTPVKIRIYGYGGTGAVSAVNFRLDDLSITAAAIAAGAAITMDPSNVSTCTGTSALFATTATGATSYQWEENSGSGFVALSNTGVYSGADNDTLMISDVTGMNGYTYRAIAMSASGDDTSAVATLTVNPMVTPAVTISGATSYCEGSAVTGVASGTNTGSSPTYQWNVVGVGPAGNNAVLFIPAGLITPGTYTVTVSMTSNAACASPSTVGDTVVVTVNPNPATPVVSADGHLLSTSEYTTYQWYYNGTTALGTDSSEVATADGNYSVVVTDINGCSATSADYAFSTTGINNYAATESISVYPNPSRNGIFNYSTEDAKAVITVYNIIGKQILNTEVNRGNHTIDLSAQANGSYFIAVKTDKQLITKKIIINK